MNEAFDPSQLLLERFREIAYAVPKTYRWIAVWILLYLEPLYIEYVTRKTVDKAIEEYHKEMDTLELPTYTIESKPSEVEGLDEIRIYHDYTKHNRDSAEE